MRDGTLTLELAGPSSKEWNARFRGALALLGNARTEWGEVRITKKSIKVAGPRQGSESELRHFLESVVLQANAGANLGAPQTSRPDHVEREPDVEEQMAAVFRAFGNGIREP